MELIKYSKLYYCRLEAPELLILLLLNIWCIEEPRVKTPINIWWIASMFFRSKLSFPYDKVLLQSSPCMSNIEGWTIELSEEYMTLDRAGGRVDQQREGNGFKRFHYRLERTQNFESLASGRKRNSLKLSISPMVMPLTKMWETDIRYLESEPGRVGTWTQVFYIPGSTLTTGYSGLESYFWPDSLC